ncbi:MAG: hypothetical protein Athens041674_684 [Parcubacteria group bacterium Athens0416_74]|nr:MAG: hypothetical protein Athens041674_684 [Parcubacteria group bacterium Athens0416_74]
MSSMEKKTILSIVLVILILALGVLYWAFDRGVLFFSEGSLVPKFSKTAITNPMPSFGRQPTFSADFTDKAKEIYMSNVEKLTTALKEDPTRLEAWLDLAIYYRMVNDNEGAIEIWEYLRKTYPGAGISMHNLGEYYFHTAKDYEKAESYYLESISASSDIQSNYLDLYDMYKYVYKQDTDAAVDILKKGIENIQSVSAIDMMVMLGREYRDRGDKENAKKYLTEARDAAQEAGNRSLSNDLTREISAL